jgi:prolyl-tRNA editing enzyme YbaK/EbsC (Cys-tRNA(Pro) deacylase)
MPERNEERAITLVRDAAARRGVNLDVVVMDASTHTAADAAAAVGAELGQIVKSLVFVTAVNGELIPLICLVSGTNRVDVARLAAAIGEPEVRRATAREAHDLTGFSIGGIPPFGYARTVRVVMDPDLERFAVVWAAAGTGTAVFPIAPDTLRMLADADVAEITEGLPA